MKLGTTSLLPSLTVVRCSILAAAISFAHVFSAGADVTLKGNIGPRVIDDNVIIDRNSSCVLNGTIIKGNLLVKPGARLTAKRARVDGNVQAGRMTRVTIAQRTLVQGDVRGKGTRWLVVKDRSIVEGNVRLQSGSAAPGRAALNLNGAQVFGDVRAETSRGRQIIQKSEIGGNLLLVENNTGPWLLQNNRVTGDLRFFKNSGKSTISGNRVQGNLQATENSPRPVVRNNRVDGSLEIK